MKESSVDTVLEILNLSDRSLVMSTYSPASILETNLAGMGSNSAPIITQPSLVFVKGVVVIVGGVALGGGSLKSLSP